MELFGSGALLTHISVTDTSIISKILPKVIKKGGDTTGY